MLCSDQRPDLASLTLRMHAGRDEGIKRFNNPLRRHMRFLPVSDGA